MRGRFELGHPLSPVGRGFAEHQLHCLQAAPALAVPSCLRTKLTPWPSCWSEMGVWGMPGPISKINEKKKKKSLFLFFVRLFLSWPSFSIRFTAEWR